MGECEANVKHFGGHWVRESAIKMQSIFLYLLIDNFKCLTVETSVVDLAQLNTEPRFLFKAVICFNNVHK